MDAIEENKYWPCLLVEHDNYCSIILSDFHYFDDYLGGKDCGGYTIECLAKKLAKEHEIKNIKFDSEAGMFCAYSKDQNALLKLCLLFAEIVGAPENYQKENTQPLIPLNEAEKLLLRGFVMGLDVSCQETFYQNVPYPGLNKKQKEYLDNLQSADSQIRILALKKINSEARTLTRKWNNYLSHPKTIEVLIQMADKENEPKVYEELMATLHFICDRHLPDLRVKPYFLKCLKHKTAQIRYWGLSGLSRLHILSIEDFQILLNDKSEKVRNEANACIEQIQQQAKDTRKFPSWMFSKENYPKELLNGSKE